MFEEFQRINGIRESYSLRSCENSHFSHFFHSILLSKSSLAFLIPNLRSHRTNLIVNFFRSYHFLSSLIRISAYDERDLIIRFFSLAQRMLRIFHIHKLHMHMYLNVNLYMNHSFILHNPGE